MINKQSISLAEMLNGLTLQEPTDLLNGLNNVSVGGFPYTENYRNEIPSVTSENEHSQVLDLVSDKLAALVRAGMKDISVFGVPLVRRLGETAYAVNAMSPTDGTARSYVGTNLVDVEHPFFESSLYPTEVDDKVLSYTSVDLSVYKKLEFNPVSLNELKEFINSRHPEIVNILDGYLEDFPGEETLRITNFNIFRLFNVVENNDKILVNFGKINTDDGLKIEELLLTYVLLTKMKSSEDVPSFVTGGSLEDYRSFVHLAWNGLTKYLITLKQFCGAYAKRELVVVHHERPRFKTKDGVELIDMNVDVFYTKSVVNRLLEHNVALTEAVIGSVYKALIKKTAPEPGSDITSNSTENQQYYDKYVKTVNDRHTVDTNKQFIESGLRLILDLISENEGVHQVFQKRAKDKGLLITTLISNLFANDLDLTANRVKFLVKENNIDFNNLGETATIERFTDFVNSSSIAVKYLETIGCHLGASILARTVRDTTKGDMIEQRVALTEGLVEEIVSLCFKD